eukprot:scaffold205023_cov17-Prasinocladus_malaysianus.AAC.1
MAPPGCSLSQTLPPAIARAMPSHEARQGLQKKPRIYMWAVDHMRQYHSSGSNNIERIGCNIAAH